MLYFNIAFSNYTLLRVSRALSAGEKGSLWCWTRRDVALVPRASLMGNKTLAGNPIFWKKKTSRVKHYVIHRLWAIFEWHDTVPISTEIKLRNYLQEYGEITRRTVHDLWGAGSHLSIVSSLGLSEAGTGSCHYIWSSHSSGHRL